MLNKLSHRRITAACVTALALGAPTSYAYTCAIPDAAVILEWTPVVFLAEVTGVGPERTIEYKGSRILGSRVVLRTLESFKGQARREGFQTGREYSCHPELKKGKARFSS